MPAVPVRVPSQRPLAPSVTSVTPVANDKGDNEMIPETMHRSPNICLTTEENPGKPELGDQYYISRLFYYSCIVFESLICAYVNLRY